MTDPDSGAEPSGPQTTVLRLGGPADIIDAAPYLLGFHPRDSLVLVGMDAQTGAVGHAPRVGVVARMDLADVMTPGLLARTVTAIVRPETIAVVALAFTDGPIDASLASAVTGAVQGDAEVELMDLLVVTDDRWWSALCDDPDCADAGGRRRTDAPSATVVEATVAGMVALPQRSDVVGLFSPDADRDRLAGDLDAAGRRWSLLPARAADRRHRSAVRQLFAATRELPVLDDAQVVRFGAALAQPPVFESCWLAAEASRIDGDGVWRELARRLPAPWDAPALFLAGWDLWRRGSGTQAGIAAERALGSCPGFAPAELLMSALASGMDPFRTPRMRRGA